MIGVAFSAKYGNGDRVVNDFVCIFDLAVGFTPRLGLVRRRAYSTGWHSFVSRPEPTISFLPRAPTPAVE